MLDARGGALAGSCERVVVGDGSDGRREILGGDGSGVARGRRREQYEDDEPDSHEIALRRRCGEGPLPLEDLFWHRVRRRGGGGASDATVL